MWTLFHRTKFNFRTKTIIDLPKCDNFHNFNLSWYEEHEHRATWICISYSLVVSVHSFTDFESKVGSRHWREKINCVNRECHGAYDNTKMNRGEKSNLEWNPGEDVSPPSAVVPRTHSTSTQFEASAHTNGGPPTHITMDTGFHYTEFIIEWMETLTSASDRVGSWIYTQHRAAADGAAVAAQRYTIWWKTISQLPQSVILIRFRRRRCHAESERKRYLVSDTHKLNLRSSGFVLNGNAFGVGSVCERRTKYNFVNFLSRYRRPVRPWP